MEETLLKTIDGLEEFYLDVLEDVCNMESPTSNKTAVDAVGNYFGNMARKFGWRTDVFSQDVAGDVVCITMNPDRTEAPICLSGHIDTVFQEGAFGEPPVRRDEKNMYGPGVMDCKGGVVAAFMAMGALYKCGYQKRPVRLILQTDEETGSATSRKATINCMCKAAQNAVAFFNLEGHKSGTAVLTRKGILRFKFDIYGKALHSSRCFDGANAIAEAAHKILALEEMKDPDGLTCNCGVIAGGSTANSVAEHCSFYADFRFLNAEELKKAKAEVQRITQSTAIKGCSCTATECSFRPPMSYSEKNNALLEKMNKIYRKCSLPILRARNCLSGSDAAYITEFGVPCVDCIGTEGNNIHSTLEYISLRSLAESAKRIATAVYFFDDAE